MAFPHHLNFAEVLSATDGRVELAFQVDLQKRPWQALHPQHPVLLDKYFFFGPFTALMALDLVSAEVQTALTALSWQCDDLDDPTVPTRGVCSFPGSAERDPSFVLELFTAAGERLVRAVGTGVEFATRDFAAWRAKTKAEAKAGPSPLPVQRAERSEVGLGEQWIPFVSRLQRKEGRRFATALVTTAEGFPPAAPFHSGSGDHVNVGHLQDCALQVAHLLQGGPVRCTGGEAKFRRYVELDVPFELHVIEANDERVHLRGIQLGRSCFELTIHTG